MYTINKINYSEVKKVQTCTLQVSLITEKLKSNDLNTITLTMYKFRVVVHSIGVNFQYL